MAPKTDTGLHISMRLLLGIVAGLLISDMLKAAVKTLDAGGDTGAIGAFNAFVVFAAILFLIRIVVDNVLYYNEPDARTTAPAYGARVALIFIDLASYAFCYHMVAVIEPSAGKTTAFANRVVSTLAADMAFVELLHFIWCIVAIKLLPVSTTEHSERMPLLTRWCWLSGSFAVLSGAAWLLLERGLTVPWGGVVVFGLSFVSAVSYMVSMRDRQYLGPAAAWKA